LKTFALTFVITFAVAAVVNLLWNLIGHHQAMVEWNIPFTFAIILSVVLTWMNRRESRRTKLP
jgi:branched-subunit amino acid transport protein